MPRAWTLRSGSPSRRARGCIGGGGGGVAGSLARALLPGFRQRELFMYTLVETYIDEEAQ